MKRVVLLSFSPIANDPRVRRQGDALTDAGYDVVGVGWPSDPNVAPGWPIVELTPTFRSVRQKADMASRVVLSGWTGQALRAYWSFGVHRRWLAEAVRLRGDVYHANDWRVLPIAARAAQITGGRYVYDSHEYGVEEQGDRFVWRIVFPRYVRAVESAFIGGAGFVSTVAEGIADALQRLYVLPARPLVIRNMPPYQQMPYRAPGSEVKVLYHGIFSGDRGLEAMIDSVPLWPSGYRLLLRGLGKPNYVRHLQERAGRSAADQRIEFLPPAAMLDLVRLANESDIGVFLTPGTTGHTRFALPNKVFEYAMAGLALCVSDVAEITPVVEKYDLGVTVPQLSPAVIARVVGSLDQERIALFKQRALAAARTLSWDNEKEILLRAYERLWTVPPSPSS